MTDFVNNTDILRTFEFAVKYFRKKANLSQKEFAACISKSAVAISMLERGLINPSLTTIKAIADVLGIDLPLLFSTPDCICVSQGQLVKHFYPMTVARKPRRKEKK